MPDEPRLDPRSHGKRVHVLVHRNNVVVLADGLKSEVEALAIEKQFQLLLNKKPLGERLWITAGKVGQLGPKNSTYVARPNVVEAAPATHAVSFIILIHNSLDSKRASS